MKKEKIIFVCDACEKESKLCENNFPYEDGWTYLYNFSFKLNDRRNKNKDKHFCSVVCLKQYIESCIGKLKENGVK